MDLIVSAVAFAGGYLVGSIPLSARVLRVSADVVAGDVAGGALLEGGTGPSDVSRLAGPGWGLLAMTGEVAKGLLPVAIGLVTWSWWVGWAAGLGALFGAGWPLLGRRRGMAVRAGGPGPGTNAGGRGLGAPAGAMVCVIGGVLVALAPAAGLVALLLALVAAGVARIADRAGLAVAVAAGLAAYPVLFLLDQADAARLAGIAVLYVVAGLRTTTIRR